MNCFLCNELMTCSKSRFKSRKLFYCSCNSLIGTDADEIISIQFTINDITVDIDFSNKQSLISILNLFNSEVLLHVKYILHFDFNKEKSLLEQVNNYLLLC